ncbi:MAG: hypothetical protein RO469_02640 [Thermincola sp.]|nr:hypothetical protein [Thermincola sp.]
MPYILPAVHAGNGLLAGNDSTRFHQTATDLADQIHSGGWSAWTLRPNGWGTAGIAGAIYALTVPQPWTLIPVNAALHATAALFLANTMFLFLNNWRRSAIAALPFLLYPSAMNWYTQLLKDNYFVPGTVISIYGWLLLIRLESWQNNWMKVGKAIALIFSGITLVWLVRPYGVQMLQGIMAVNCILVTGLFIYRGWRSVLQWPKVMMGIITIWVIIGLISPFTKAGIHMTATDDFGTGLNNGGSAAYIDKQKDKTDEAPEETLGGIPADNTGKSSHEPTTEMPNGSTNQARQDTTEPGQSVSQDGKQAEKPNPAQSETMEKPSRIFAAINNRLFTLAEVRAGFLRGYTDNDSNIDFDVNFEDAGDIIRYLPRALEISLFAPFPNQWFNSRSGVSKILNSVAALENVFIYLTMAFVPFALWQWRRQAELWVLVLFSVGMMWVYGLVIPNIGALYRVRYSFIMTVAAIGISGGFMVLQKYCDKKQTYEGEVFKC